jgi:hypothetical protein
MGFSRGWFLAGLFFVTLVTLCIEVLFTRLLSVTLWYHLSFFAVSTAMFGMSAGALQVYLSGRAFEGAGTMHQMRRLALLFALCVPLSHLVLLVVPMPLKADTLATQSLSVILVMTIAVAVPFFVSGMLVTIALTRVPGRIGLTYAVDLVGAALGTLLVFPLLQGGNISSAFLLCGALATVGALCFHVAGGGRMAWSVVLAGALLAWGGIANRGADDPLRVWFPKGHAMPSEHSEEFWNVHAEVTLVRVPTKGPHYWGPGKGADEYENKIINMAIDGAAGTVITQWDGQPDSLQWAEHDVTSVPYQLRRGGDAAIIGVGGGRDVLTALRFECESVTGIEINSILLDFQTGEMREVARLADHPAVTLVHDEARSYLTRVGPSYDVLQMSLIDTWAATGAGAMTLTENGLYTLEAWEVFLGTLKPGGLFSVSRWYDPRNVSETNRLVALGVAALLERGIARPSEHLALVACGKVATLLTGIDPIPPEDVLTLRDTAERFGFEVVFAPGQSAGDPQLAAIAGAESRAALTAASEHELYDYSPPTDERPFFFNLLKLRGAFSGAGWGDSPGVVAGNLRATSTLAVLLGVSFLLVVAVILVPLASSGLPRTSAASFLLSLWYFVAIGVGFMLVQIPCMQRFSVYLGHPVYALVVLLFSMIAATGLGSYVSDRLRIEDEARITRMVPLAIALAIALLALLVQPVIDATIGWSLALRVTMVIAMITPVAFLLGFGFPLGMRLVQRFAPDAMPWMWGVNGAASVFAAVMSIIVSMAFGIHTNLYAAVLLYGSLALVAPALWRRGALSGRA